MFIKQSHEIISISDNILENIELAARTCYKSEKKISKHSSRILIKKLIKSNHLAMIEFGHITVKFITDRGVSHELVRHRLCSFAQESTRYVNYQNKGIKFIYPVWYNSKTGEQKHIWTRAMDQCATNYNQLINSGELPGQARSVLPNSLKTEIVVSANIREWRHLLKLRTSRTAHSQIRGLMIPLLKELTKKFSCLFSDIHPFIKI